MMENNLNIEFNAQVNKEFSSAYLYYAMSSYFSQINLEGFAKYMKEQAIEELNHAQKIYDFMILRRANIKFERIEAPDMLFSSPIDAFSKAVEHEKYITCEILKLYDSAKKVKDSMSEIFLQDMIMEQIEEEDKFQKIYDRIQSNEECSYTIDHIDYELK